MKAYKAIYSHGHFIDVETNQRLVPVQGEEYTITAKDKAFKTESSAKKFSDALDSKAKAIWAENKFGKNNFVKLIDSKQQLFFRVGNSKRVEGDEDRQYIFLCILLEDLYLYLMKGKKGNDVEDWRLADCKCELHKCLLGGLTLTSNVESNSLNSLFNYTVQDYFRGQRSGSTNAVTTFFIYKDGIKITFEDATWHQYDGLSDLRRQFVAKRK